MGVAGLVVKVVLLFVALLVVLGGSLYATDFPVEATVRSKNCGAGTLFGPGTDPGTITVETKLFGIDYTMADVPPSTCHLVQEDNFVQYHIRSGRTSLYESEGGSCIYDSVGGVGGCA